MTTTDLSEFIAAAQANQRRLAEAHGEVDPCPECGAVLPENRERCLHDACPLRETQK
jgi:hypothetical protein